MKLHSDIKRKVYSSVVPVICGNEQGTAFFVSGDTLLTARHILADYYDSQGNVPVIIEIEDGVLCIPEPLAEEGDNIDVIKLKCQGYSNPCSLVLLASNFNEDTTLTIVGYPSEFGHSTDIISLEVKNRLNVTKQDYDTTVVRTDSLAFSSYKGYSGSPVVNESGSVIGIVIKQQNQGIGYRSIKSLSELLTRRGINIKQDWQSEDYTPLGRGTSRRQVEDAIRYAALRYNPMLHVANKDFDADIDKFSFISNENAILAKLTEKESLAINTFLKINTNIDLSGYNIGLFDKLPMFISDIRENLKLNKKQEIEFDNLYKDVKYLLPEWHGSKIKRIVIMGHAGIGKTHYVCSTAERLSKDMHVYLLFGSRFSSSLDFTEQLISLMKISPYNLDDLNDRMKNEKENALIIIDAINEGATDAFWQNAIKQIEGDFDRFERIKFIITFRDKESRVNVTSWETVKLTGFEDNIVEAINKYFTYYGIDDRDGKMAKKYRREFNEPLFLSIFCQVFQYYHGGDWDELTYSRMFRLYIYFRNDKVSEKVDEDPHRNITKKLLFKLANYSLYYNQCQDIPREKARQYADQICRNRTWSKSLLYWTLRENLLMSTITDKSYSVMFGFQKMGDFLMADVFNESKLTDENKIDKIIEYSKQHSYRRFVIALLTDWDLTPKLLDKPLIRINAVIPLLLDSLKHNGKNNANILEWMNRNNLVSVNILHDYFQELPLTYFEHAHENLLSLSLSSRDLHWTINVNDLYQEYDPKRFDRYVNIKITNEDDAKKFVLFLCWLSTSTHPIIRSKVRRFLIIFIEKNGDGYIDYILAKFHSCNDPYVLQVITSAIYGHLLRKRNMLNSKHVAKLVLQYFYTKDSSVVDILVRQWSMLILYYADYLNKTDYFSKAIHYPFNTPNPYSLIKDQVVEEDRNYFGTSNGCRLMHETLFGFMDFNRYIIGTNNRNFSNVFYKRNGNKLSPILLSDIKLMIANIAKYDLGWDTKLGEYDNGKYSPTEYDNKIERFGKKYLWLALYQADALLSDHFCMVDDSYYTTDPSIDLLADKPYPWFTREYSHIDPTIISEKETEAVNLHFAEFESVDNISNEQWMKPNCTIPNPRLYIRSEDGTEWIVLSCYDGFDVESENKTIKSFFLFTNGGLVKNSQKRLYIEWAKNQNFYGRWMPEVRNGATEYIWNEYPWSPTYSRTLRYYEKDAMEYTRDTPFEMELSFEGQLQEHWGDLDKEKMDLGEVLMPNHDIMENLGLFTAERGVVRDCQHPNIKVAVNFRQGELYGLAIRRDYMDKYLRERQLCLVYYSTGEKYVRAVNQYMPIGLRYELSGSSYYNPQEGSKIIQSMTIMNLPEKGKNNRR